MREPPLWHIVVFPVKTVSPTSPWRQPAVHAQFDVHNKKHRSLYWPRHCCGILTLAAIVNHIKCLQCDRLNYMECVCPLWRNSRLAERNWDWIGSSVMTKLAECPWWRRRWRKWQRQPQEKNDDHPQMAKSNNTMVNIRWQKLSPEAVVVRLGNVRGRKWWK